MPVTYADEFSEDGFVRVPRAFERADAETMCALMWGVLERDFGILESDPSTWTRPFRKRPLNEIGASPLFWSIFGDRLLSAMDDVLGEGEWELPEVLGDFLITFPNATKWELPPQVDSQGWHSDEGYAPGIMAFVFLNDVPPQGGGTLIVRGSHRLGQRDYRQAAQPDDAGRKWKQRWRSQGECDWLRELRVPGDPHVRHQKFMERKTEVVGVSLQVVELSGQAGDAVLCHPWLVHSVAPNAADRPRFMRTPRIRGMGADATRRSGAVELARATDRPPSASGR